MNKLFFQQVFNSMFWNLRIPKPYEGETGLKFHNRHEVYVNDNIEPSEEGIFIKPYRIFLKYRPEVNTTVAKGRFNLWIKRHKLEAIQESSAHEYFSEWFIVYV